MFVNVKANVNGAPTSSGRIRMRMKIKKIRKAESGNGLQGREENSVGRSPGKSGRKGRALKGRKRVILSP